MEFLNFFEGRDWLGRGWDSYLYAPEYLIFFTVAIAVAIILPLTQRNRTEQTLKKILIGLWLFLLIYDVSKFCLSWTSTALHGDGFNPATALPFHACSTIWYSAPIALLARKESTRRAWSAYLCSINLFGGIIGMFLGTAMMHHYSFISYYGSQMMIYHSMLVIIPMFMLITGYYNPRWQDVLPGFSVFGIIALPTFIFDTIFRCDYMYIYDGSTLEPFKALAAMMPHRLLWTLIAVIGYFLLIVIFLGAAIVIRKTIEKKRAV